MDSARTVWSGQEFCAAQRSLDREDRSANPQRRKGSETESTFQMADFFSKVDGITQGIEQIFFSSYRTARPFTNRFLRDS